MNMIQSGLISEDITEAGKEFILPAFLLSLAIALRDVKGIGDKKYEKIRPFFN